MKAYVEIYKQTWSKNIISPIWERMLWVTPENVKYIGSLHQWRWKSKQELITNSSHWALVKQVRTLPRGRSNMRFMIVSMDLMDGSGTAS